jgi:hypothetical protein
MAHILGYKHDFSGTGQPGLVRAIGQRSLAALMVDSSIGSGILAPLRHRESRRSRGRGRSLAEQLPVSSWPISPTWPRNSPGGRALSCILALLSIVWLGRSGLDDLAGATRRTGGYRQLVGDLLRRVLVGCCGLAPAIPDFDVSVRDLDADQLSWCARTSTHVSDIFTVANAAVSGRHRWCALSDGRPQSIAPY